VLEPLAANVGRAAAAGSASLELITGLLRTCAAWGVSVPEGVMGPIARACEVFVRQVVNGMEPGLISALFESTRFKAETARAATASSLSSDRVLRELLEGAVLPLAQLGQAFPESEVFFAALHHWRARGFPDWSARRAALLLRGLAVPGARGWHHRIKMR
ncbi:hypothetical protein Agub_g5698, partial [Astrephomene gubernaculifera]